MRFCQRVGILGRTGLQPHQMAQPGVGGLLQRNSRQMAKANPLTGPCLMSACLAYSEQVGVNLHEGGV